PDLVPLHHPGLRQRPRLAGPTTPPRRGRLRATRQRLYPPRRPDPGPVVGRPLPAPRLGQDPGRLGPPGQPAAPRALAAGPGLLLGHRPGRIQHRCPLPRPARPGRPLPTVVGPRLPELLCPGYSDVPGAPPAPALRWRGADRLQEGPLARGPDQAPG